MPKVVIAHARLEGSALLSLLSLSPLRFSPSLLADLIFNDCSPSWSVVFCLDTTHATVARLERAQQHFRNSFAILVGAVTDQEWVSFQARLSMGTMRLVRVIDEATAASVVCTLRDALNCGERFTAQTQFFSSLATAAEGSAAAEEVYRRFLSELDVPVPEQDIILEAFPSLQLLFTATRQSLNESLPVAAQTIDQLALLLEDETSITPGLGPSPAPSQEPWPGADRR